MIEIFKEKILRLLGKRQYSPLKLSELAEALNVEPEGQEFQDFKDAYKTLRRQGKILVGGKKLITLSPPKGIITGTFRGNPKGFGFVEPLDGYSHEDLFISPNDTNGAMSGDKVQVEVIKKGVRGGRMAFAGIVNKIIERGHSQFVGLLSFEAGRWVAKPDGSTIVEPVAVDDVTAKGARQGDKVIVEIIKYPDGYKIGQGVILEVLGRAGLYETEIKAVIAQYEMPTDFEEDCIEQARQAASDFDGKCIDKREDITDKVIITIDPESAKDFDDAISLEKTKDGNWLLGVHIADVSEFVPMESPLDREAKKRGNSVYLPGKTIPMLPEILSNGICSLQPNQKRYAKSIYITYDSKGNVIDRNFANSLIMSKCRLSYEQAEETLKGNSDGIPAEAVELLNNMNSLAKVIEQRRIANGMLHLDLAEIEIIYDQTGQVIDAQPADTSYPHTIIEMFMVEANEASASLLDRYNVPFMRRIHPEPDGISTKNLARFVRICGLKVPNKLDRRAMQDLINKVKGTPAEFAVNVHILRSLAKAEYSPLRIGHFALASENYSHFTSPIRRYADLMVHRLIDVYIKGKLNLIGLEEIVPDSELKEIGRHITFAEQRADNAEQELKKILVLELLAKHIGDHFEGAISGLANFGIFVHLHKYGIEGMFELAALGADEWKLDDRSGAVVGQNSGKRIEMGQAIMVQIVSVNLAARQLNLAPIKPLVERIDKKSAKRSRRK